MYLLNLMNFLGITKSLYLKDPMVQSTLLIYQLLDFIVWEGIILRLDALTDSIALGKQTNGTFSTEVACISILFNNSEGIGLKNF